MSAHDRYLAGYSRSTVEVYCHDRACREFGGEITVTYEREHGQGWTTPEECPGCGGELHDDPAPDPE